MVVEVVPGVEKTVFDADRVSSRVSSDPSVRDWVTVGRPNRETRVSSYQTHTPNRGGHLRSDTHLPGPRTRRAAWVGSCRE